MLSTLAAAYHVEPTLLALISVVRRVPADAEAPAPRSHMRLPDRIKNLLAKSSASTVGYFGSLTYRSIFLATRRTQMGAPENARSCRRGG